VVPPPLRKRCCAHLTSNSDRKCDGWYQALLEEKTRIEKAIDDVRQSLTIDAKEIEGKLGKHAADIFLAQEAILLDSSVVEELKRILEAELINAEQVVRTVFRLLARRFSEMNNEVFRERGDDIDDLSRRLLLSLRESSSPAFFPVHRRQL